MDAAEITTDVEEIHLDMKIQRIKELKLVAQVTYGGGATEENTTITVNPASIRVTGSDAALAELGDSYTLAEIDCGRWKSPRICSTPSTCPTALPTRPA